MGEDLIVTVARRHRFADHDAQILGEPGIGIEDRLVLTDKTTQLSANLACAFFLRRIGEHLACIKGQKRRRRDCQHGQQDENPFEYLHPYSASCAARLLARDGAPIRSRRSVTEISAPSYIHGTPGVQ